MTRDIGEDWLRLIGIGLGCLGLSWFVFFVSLLASFGRPYSPHPPCLYPLPAVSSLGRGAEQLEGLLYSMVGLLLFCLCFCLFVFVFVFFVFGV